eukprot:TRINITY_DN7625_c0_g2_i1.p1 TRINITY_DN7625_c0_g2~~TRINITY_DN7625_c0_g2_i1.p1  ORF type:complete len:187 (-),score=37.27 TRINITY_DN7625_c0_g2_i1:382-942(-)
MPKKGKPKPIVKKKPDPASFLPKKGQKGKKRGRKRECDAAYMEHFTALQAAMRVKGIYMRDVEGDGNCLFRAVSDQLEGNEANHRKYRVQAFEYLAENPQEFMPYIDTDTTSWDDYLKQIYKDGEWGDNVELQALSQKLLYNFVIHMRDAPPVIIQNFESMAPDRTLHLAYHLGESLENTTLASEL